jgi:hypothetical protein
MTDAKTKSGQKNIQSVTDGVQAMKIDLQSKVPNAVLVAQQVYKTTGRPWFGFTAAVSQAQPLDAEKRKSGVVLSAGLRGATSNGLIWWETMGTVQVVAIATPWGTLWINSKFVWALKHLDDTGTSVIKQLFGGFDHGRMAFLVFGQKPFTARYITRHLEDAWRNHSKAPANIVVDAYCTEDINVTLGAFAVPTDVNPSAIAHFLCSCNPPLIIKAAELVASQTNSDNQTKSAV